MLMARCYSCGEVRKPRGSAYQLRYPSSQNTATATETDAVAAGIDKVVVPTYNLLLNIMHIQKSVDIKNNLLN